MILKIDAALDRIEFVFLDRDGVLNRKLPEGVYAKRREDLELFPAAVKALASLNKKGYTVILVTNQRGVGLGYMTESELNALHEELQKDLAQYGARLDAIYYCPHDPSTQECTCRKPLTGLFEQAIRDFPAISKRNSILIGDSLSDIQAGINLGVPTIFIEGEPLHRKPGAEQALALATEVAQSLDDAVTRVLGISRCT
jgi:D-glycero-D-manno-heptose 1,7-bisphosphate phosphatase